MGFTMGLNLLLLVAMVATNILSLYHLSSNIQQQNPKPPTPHHVPDYLVHQLQTIRATINHLTRHQNNPPDHSVTRPTATSIPSDLLVYSHLSPIASSCHNHPELLHKYMNYTPFSLCPPGSDDVVEALILRGCHPLPRRRCFSKTPPKPSSSSLPQNPFPAKLLDDAVLWSRYSSCKSFDCLNRLNPNMGFDMSNEISNFMAYKSELDLPIPQLLQIAKAASSVLRLGLDIGGGTGTFAGRMKLYNVTVVTTTLNVVAPYNEAVALRGLVPLHVPLQQRLPVFDGAVDIVRCGRAVNRWIPAATLEFLLFDVDRVLRAGGYLWLDHFFSKGVDLEKVYAPLIGKLGYRKVKWATASKTDSAGLKNGEVYLTALLQKPVPK
ncbi:S-adenosyl-L-methionine-dependent methyltransferase superfamily protein [Parasponia andersonii]|uniref:S-adenosyl-L-methionine-dependent methyltransferase superfamily protein n=1 Tax=Parasponia andersonii TaxID=3476 RepID=A0A2P5AYX2_PARAD|nr:S-adenosyl-L-methionine-dependent methyltransferase superfamily protein [Parasponia andersonii]